MFSLQLQSLCLRLIRRIRRRNYQTNGENQCNQSIVSSHGNLCTLTSDPLQSPLEGSEEELKNIASDSDNGDNER